MKKIYAGKLMIGSNGHESDILFLDNDIENPLASNIYDDIIDNGNYLSVCYYIYSVDAQKDIDALEVDFFKSLYGYGEIDYEVRYSEPTGYLWTDEKIKVGGHDLLKEFKSAIGKWIWLKIEYNRQERS
jgi:hypothetical protein